MEPPVIELSKLSLSDLQEINIDESPLQHRILEILCDMFGVEHDLKSIDNFIHNYHTLKRLEDYKLEYLTPSVYAKLEEVFEKRSMEYKWFSVHCKKGILGIYQWLHNLYKSKKRDEILKEFNVNEDEDLNYSSFNQMAPVVDAIRIDSQEERANFKAELNIAAETLEMIEKELKTGSCLANLSTPTNRINKLISAIMLLFDKPNDWIEAKEFIGNHSDFAEKAKNLKSQTLKREKN